MQAPARLLVALVIVSLGSVVLHRTVGIEAARLPSPVAASSIQGASDCSGRDSLFAVRLAELSIGIKLRGDTLVLDQFSRTDSAFVISLVRTRNDGASLAGGGGQVSVGYDGRVRVIERYR